jgi:hypothetical protein
LGGETIDPTLSSGLSCNVRSSPFNTNVAMF